MLALAGMRQGNVTDAINYLAVVNDVQINTQPNKHLTLENSHLFCVVPCCFQHVGGRMTPNLEENLPAAGPTFSSVQHATTTITMATHQLVHESRSGLEEMESEGKMGFIANLKCLSSSCCRCFDTGSLLQRGPVKDGTDSFKENISHAITYNT